MNDVVIASNEADARAAEAVEQHHAELAGALTLAVEGLTAAARGGQPAAAEERRLDLVGWCREELVPHALAEETTMYAAAGTDADGAAAHRGDAGRAPRDHGARRRAGGHLRAGRRQRAGPGPPRPSSRCHLAKENDRVLPLLVAAPEVSVADLLGGMHELLGGEARRRARCTGAAESGEAGHELHLRRGRRPRAARARRPVRPARDPARDRLRCAATASRPGTAWCPGRPHDPLPAAGPARAARPGAVRRRLPRARPRASGGCG